jgi:pilus assembly protein CpaB
MKMNHRFLYGILSIVLAAIIAFIAIPAVTSRTNSTCEIVRMKTAVPRGKPITADDLEVVEVGGFNLPDSVARKVGDVAGTYAATDLYPGDYILPEKVSSVPLSSDLSLNGIPDGMVAISITTQTLATSLSDKLQGGDIIRLYHYDDNNVLEPVSDIPELRFVKVLSVSDPKGLDVDYTTPPGEDEERQQTATITVLATPEQALLLTRFENEGVLHVALISRDNEKLSEELLERQSEILSALYGDGMELPDGSPELSGSDGDDSQGNSPADFGKPADTKQDIVPENISGTE